MPKFSKDIRVGRRYTCKVRGKDAVVRVQEVDTFACKFHGTVRIKCTQEITNRIVVFRSPSRLIVELGEHTPALWRPKRIVPPELPPLGRVATRRFLFALERGTQNALTVWAGQYNVALPYGEYRGRVRLAVKALLQRGKV